MGHKLIVIEDDATIVHLLKRNLKRVKWTPELLHFEYGEDAMDFFNDGEDKEIIILLDLNLPDTTGIEILKNIRQMPDYNKTPVIVATTSNLEGERASCHDLGVKYYFEKPFKYEALISVLQMVDLGQ